MIVCGEECETIRTHLLLLLASKLISPLAVPQRFFFMLVTWGSVWAKMQGVLKKAHRGTLCHQNTQAHTRNHKHSHRNRV